jgi:hypothetical protein
LLTSERDKSDWNVTSGDLAMQRGTVVSIRWHTDESLTPAPRRVLPATAETRNHVTPAILRCREYSKLTLSR